MSPTGSMSHASHVATALPATWAFTLAYSPPNRHGVALPGARQLERLQRRIDHATTGLGRITNRHVVTDLRDEYDARTAALTRLDHQLEELDVERAGLPTRDRITQRRAQWRDLHRRLDAAARQRVTVPPDHLVDSLGPMPDDRGGRQRLAADSDQHRDLPVALGLTDPDRSLGPEPDNPLQQDDRRRVLEAIEDHQRERHLNANVAAAGASASAVLVELLREASIPEPVLRSPGRRSHALARVRRVVRWLGGAVGR
jgi:hypothetical protein